MAKKPDAHVDCSFFASMDLIIHICVMTAYHTKSNITYPGLARVHTTLIWLQIYSLRVALHFLFCFSICAAPNMFILSIHLCICERMCIVKCEILALFAHSIQDELTYHKHTINAQIIWINCVRVSRQKIQNVSRSCNSIHTVRNCCAFYFRLSISTYLLLHGDWWGSIK